MFIGETESESFVITMTELCSCNRDRMVHKTEGIYYMAFYRKKGAEPLLRRKMLTRIERNKMASLLHSSK